MPPFLNAEPTTFTLDNMGRFLCNTLQEARDSVGLTVADRRRDFDVIIIGGGTFGAVMAEHLFVTDATRSRRILVLEAGPFVLPEHVQNLPFLGGAPNMRTPWVSHPALSYAGLLFAIGGRSLTWGGWSPELLDEEMTAWPPDVRTAMRPSSGEGYFAQASRQIGVQETNDFIYGRLHTALRKQLHAGLRKPENATGFSFAELLDHPAVRFPDPAEPPLDEAILRDWLDLPATDTTPKAELLELFKLEAPLAVQSNTLPGFFPFNKFSAIPGLIRAARLAADESAGVGPAADARKRLMVVPNCHVQDLITETQPDNWVRVKAVRVWDHGSSIEIPLAPPREGRQSVVILAAGTVETTRLALTTFRDSLAGRAAERMGRNLMAHLRSNLFIRIPQKALEANLPPSSIPSLQTSALFVKGKAPNGRTFHFQITATGLGRLGIDSEAELFKKVPTLEHIEALRRASDDTVVITIRGIADMSPHNPDSFVELSATDGEFDRPKAVVHVGNSKARPQDFPGSPQTQNDRNTWNAMDALSDKIALIFAGDEPFEILAGARVIRIAAGTRAARLTALSEFKARRDDLGTTHHDAGTLRMGDDVADAVTNDFGRVHDVTNCYVAGPALFPTVGSPNPMLTGVALARRTSDLLRQAVLPGPDHTGLALETGFKPLFDGTAASFGRWRLAGPQQGGGMLHLNGEMVSHGNDGAMRLLFYAAESFTDFTLRLQFRVADLQAHNSGVFVRFPSPLLDLATEELKQRAAREPAFDAGNPAWKPVLTGFEVQIDDTAAGDSSKDFYGIRPEPNGLFKNRTGAIYKIQAGDRVWHLNMDEPQVQDYTPGPPLLPGVWFEYEIVVSGDHYTVFLTNTQSGHRVQTTAFTNTDPERGRAPGLIGLQVYSGQTVAWRHIRIKT